MTKITLTTVINAPVERCFDLSRSIELHVLSTGHTRERAVAGRMNGLAEKGDSITSEATHFAVRQRLTTIIEEVRYPDYFSDRMVNGAFKSMYHEHIFAREGPDTLMTDIFWYEPPLGFWGDMFDAIVLKRYMTAFLLKRNRMIKTVAEGTAWEEILQHRCR